MEIEPMTASDAVRALLVANDLPVDDLADPAVELFGVHDGAEVVGVIGIQWLDGAALLRSLAVAAKARDRGLGAQLCDAVIRQVTARGCPELWLLTTSAKDYFGRRGFVVVPRDQVPASVRATAQFSSLCPSSAVVMRRA